MVGGRIEQQIQSIGQRLGENITQGLIEPFAQPNAQSSNPTYQMIAEKISQIEVEHNQHIDKLVESAIFESLEAIRKQVKVKQWQQILNEGQQQNIS